MTRRALVERNTVATTDGYGAKGKPTWTTLHESLPCWFYRQRRPGGEAVRLKGTVVREMLKLMVPLGTDITEADRINGITDRSGNVVEVGILNVTSVLDSHTHLELMLEKVA